LFLNCLNLTCLHCKNGKSINVCVYLKFKTRPHLLLYLTVGKKTRNTIRLKIFVKNNRQTDSLRNDRSVYYALSEKPILSAWAWQWQNAHLSLSLPKSVYRHYFFEATQRHITTIIIVKSFEKKHYTNARVTHTHTHTSVRYQSILTDDT